MTEEKRPKVGVGVFIKKDGKILMQKRQGAHGEGSWGLPGGHLEFGESEIGCAERETKEELGINITNVVKGPYTNDIFESEDRHYITIFVISDYDGGEIKIMEPDKIIEFGWFDWNELPRPLFLPIINLLKTDFSPFN
jgi:8-oxo-dGTP diphosphatase